MQLLTLTVILFAGFSLVAQAAESPSKKPAPASKATQPDVKFLEYLGTLEADDENWTDIATTVLAEPKGKGAAKSEAVAKPAAEKK